MPCRIAIRTPPTVGCHGLAFRQDGMAARAAVTGVWITAYLLRHERRPA